MDMDFTERVLEGLKASKKYRFLHEDLLRRVATWASMNQKSVRAAVKAAKSKLHQIYGAFVDDKTIRDVYAAVEPLSAETSSDKVMAICRQVLERHASTRERVPALDEFYTKIFEVTGTPKSIVDLGCGLNTFSLPWMNLSNKAVYYGVDIDERLVSVCAEFLQKNRVRGEVLWSDLFSLPRFPQSDVTLLLKLSPTLERQRKGATAELLQKTSSRYIVLSFPTESLGGRGAGMESHYDSFMEAFLEQGNSISERLRIGNELIYILFNY